MTYRLIMLSIIYWLFTSSCSIKKLLPLREITSKELNQIQQDFSHKNVEYISLPITEIPIIPFQIFAVPYKLDIVLVSDHPNIDMHEFALIDLPYGKTWIAKESQKGSLDQSIYTDDKRIETLFPEIPLPIQQCEMRIIESRKDQELDVTFEYTNLNGDSVEAHYHGSTLLKTLKKPNGSTMGHSKNQVMALLDLSSRSFGRKAEIQYNGEKAKIKKILGIRPFQMMLKQTQAGLSVGSKSIIERDGEIHSEQGEMIKSEKWAIKSLDTMLSFHTKNVARKIEYNFSKNQSDLQFSNASIQYWNHRHKTMDISVYPPLPDLRRKFILSHSSKFVIHVNEKALGYGRIEVSWKSLNEVAPYIEILIIPEHPWWIKERPMTTIIKIVDREVQYNFSMAEKEEVKE